MFDTSMVMDEILGEFRGRGGVVVAFSGGVDSSVVASLAYEALGSNSVAVTVRSEVFSESEIDYAVEVAEEIGIKHKVIDLDLLELPEFRDNPVNRCYLCKKEMMDVLFEVASDLGFESVADGTTATDFDKERPGAEALEEFGVFTPLADQGLNKDQVRILASELGLPNSDRPSMSCLATRIPYGEEIDVERLERIEEAEVFLKEIGFEQVRVRDHNGIARVEVSRENRGLDVEVMDEIDDRLKEIGFDYVTLDMAGYRSGSMDKLVR
ncbi:ATP-dependent sacrificial sulfur transferase LarE [Methanonatronarchaeum sp. AMET-Sl]|uniref:ATP-dependent sacrificial sulfur transferase LarE n=1 Tax=Methanonatronarchaeum sp. AMET-Sl TaxID=3037654 RepID=UPI00244DD1C7|nr:ATP-dependent sacrificial sulfur transferase LarE [Methanonatronarchaeum sp. AMET-Sl]WGI17095.1 ATP-dependent sacrificial sulfur transferase LarE [Methanonatronarchaeum sp. AMET-Sl]